MFKITQNFKVLLRKRCCEIASLGVSLSIINQQTKL